MGRKGVSPKGVRTRARGAESAGPTRGEKAVNATDDDVSEFIRERHGEMDGDLEDDDDLAEDDAGEEVMPLNIGDEESDEEEEEEAEEDEEESGEEEEEEGGGEDGGSEEDDEGDDDEIKLGAGWGTKARDFYGGGDEDEESDEEDEMQAAALEEKEAIALQRAQAARLQLDDFGEMPAAARGSSIKSRGGSSGGGLGEALDALPAEWRTGAVAVEKIARDLSSLSEKEKSRQVLTLAIFGLAARHTRHCSHSPHVVTCSRHVSRFVTPIHFRPIFTSRLVAAESPELLGLLDDFKTHVAEVRERVAPLLGLARKRQLPKSEGLAFLQLKLTLLLSYCINVTFYLLLKAQGESVKEHPVIAALLRHRVMIERLRPLEQKLKYRLQKLLQLAQQGDELPDEMNELQQRPNPAALLAADGGFAAADGEDGGGSSGASGDEGGGSKLYRPPKLAAVPYEEGRGEGRRKRDQERAVQRASSTRLVRELREELSEAPTRIHADDFGGAVGADSEAVARLRHEEEERRRYEEDNFKRLTLNKAQQKELRKKQAAAGRFTDELQNFDDFSSLYAMASGGADREDPAEEKRKALEQYMNSIERRTKKARAADAERMLERAPLHERAALRQQREVAAERKRARRREQEEREEDAAAAEADPLPEREEDPYYAELEQLAAKKKARKLAKSEAAAAATAAERRELAAGEEAGEGEKREAGRQITKNRGLTRERKKIDRNPRVKNREKFRKAVIRRKGQVREAKPQEADYGGEASGIKKNVTHSRRFKT